MMNNWKELDYIKTPEEWKMLSLKKKSINPKFRLSFIITIIIFCLSITTVIAYHNELEEWLKSYFHQENVYKANNIHQIKNKNMQLISDENNLLAYEYDIKDNEEIVKQVYLVQNHQFQKLDSSSIEGTYKGESFSFEYVIYKNLIFTYHHQGSIDYSLSYIHDDMIYVMTSDRNLALFNMKTKEIKQITHDNQSVNPIISPHGKTILINKNDNYWTVYDTQAETEKKVEDINGYALSNEIYFIDDYTISTYHSEVTNENNTCIECSKIFVIDLNTLEKTIYDEVTEFASPIVINENKSLIEIKNILTDQKYSLKTQYQDIGFYMTRQYILFFGNSPQEEVNDVGYLYSIKDNQAFEIVIPQEIGYITDILVIDSSKELLINDDKNFYFIDISHIFDTK